MEFKFRAIDNRPPFSSERSFLRGPAYSNSDPILNPTNARDARQRQMEKDRIREEILSAEVSRRRVLEIEVRRELQQEREIAMRRAAEELGFGFGFGFGEPIRVDPKVPPRFGFGGSRGSDSSSPVNEKLTPSGRISQAKPNPNLSGVKEKAPLEKGPSEVPVSGFKKINWEEAQSFRFSSCSSASLPVNVAPLWLSEPVPVNKELTPAARPFELTKDKLFEWAKPNSNLSGEKPKTPPAKGLSEVPVSCSKKINWEEAHSVRFSSSCSASLPIPVAPMWLSEPVPVNKYLTLLACPSELNEDKLIVLAKPNPNLSGMKRKSPPMKGPSEFRVSSAKKIHKEEWSCALCQVTVSNEKTFDGHLNGKRHKASEKRLQAETLSKSFNLKNTAKKIELEKLQANGTASSELGEKKERGLLEHNGVSDGLDKKMQDTDTSKEKPSEEIREELPMQNGQCGEYFKNNVEVKTAVVPQENEEPTKEKSSEETKGELPEQKDQCRDDSKNNVEVKPMLVLQRKEEPTKTKKFKFLCDFCKIGSNNPKVMEKHKKGKKHRDQLMELTEKYTDRVKELEKNKVRTTDVIKEANVHTPATTSSTYEAGHSRLQQDTEYIVAPAVVTKEANASIPTTVPVASLVATEENASLLDSINVTKEANVSIPTAVAKTSVGANEAQASVSTTDVTEEANANFPTTTPVTMASSQASDAAETVRKLEAYEKLINL